MINKDISAGNYSLLQSCTYSSTLQFDLSRHYVDFDHCLRHCAADPKIFVPVKLEPLEVHCEPYMTGLPRVSIV